MVNMLFLFLYCLVSFSLFGLGVVLIMELFNARTYNMQIPKLQDAPW